MKTSNAFAFGALRFSGALLLLSASLSQSAKAADQPPGPGIAGIRGGLLVQLGLSDLETPVRLSGTGRFVVQLLDPDPDAIDAARELLQANGRYGLVSADYLSDPRKLPYTENLVNVLVAADFGCAPGEIFRVLTPGGKVVVRDADILPIAELEGAGFEMESAGVGMLVARKPWPQGMDGWTHSRHAADGNAVSRDTGIGPPERVRWIAAATRQVEGMVSSDGLNFYGGVLARDGFNGLRQWHRDLKNAELDPADFDFQRLPGNIARPVASNDLLFAVTGDLPVALDAATGKLVREYPGVTQPREMIHHEGILITADAAGVSAFNSDSGETLWKHAADESRNLVAGNGIVVFIHGNLRRGEKSEAIALDLGTGAEKWRTSDYEWLDRVSRTVLYGEQIAFEISTLNDHDEGNSLHLLSAKTGRILWDKAFPPGMNHKRQARAMFVDGNLWILHGGKTNTVDPDNIRRIPVAVSALDLDSGETKITHPAGLAHCFPPVATPNFVIAGELDMTRLDSGEVVANRITKANCSQENGWVPANGLVYTSPKHCTCWPMLRGYVAMAPHTPGDPATTQKPVDEIEFAIERGSAQPDLDAADSLPSDWPLYRNDRWRSGSTRSAGPRGLETLWSVQIATGLETAPEPAGPILHDWRENPYVKAPISAPTIANGLVFVARPDAHQVVAVSADTGEIHWRFTADGRIDSPPAIHRGLCLFGTHGGSIYCLSADTGETVWRMDTELVPERIVAYGQLESAWPNPGAVLIADGVAYSVAGRQAFADGGILVFAFDPLTGERHWMRRIDTLPQEGYYENSGLEFDPVDILHQEGDGIAMSRWIYSRDGRTVDVDKWAGFAKLDTGDGAAWVPRGSWSYGARHQHRFPGEAPRRPLIAFRDSSVFGSLDGTTELFSREFDLENGEEFDGNWITGWAASKVARDGGKPYRTYRLAEKAAWLSDPFSTEEEKLRKRQEPQGTQQSNDIHALTLAGDGRLFAIHEDGRLKVLSTADGSVIDAKQLETPAWDGLAIANSRLYLSTQSGKLVCLGDRDQKSALRAQ